MCFDPQLARLYGSEDWIWHTTPGLAAEAIIERLFLTSLWIFMDAYTVKQ